MLEKQEKNLGLLSEKLNPGYQQDLITFVKVKYDVEFGIFPI